MFDAERVLGSLLSNVTGSKGNILGGILGGKNANKAAIGMGVVGLAIAAYEHYSNSQGQPSRQSTPAPSNAQVSSAPPPPPVSSSTSAAPPPPPPPSGSHAPAQQSSLLLIQAMIAAANADGFIDDEEKNNILENLKRAGSDAEGINYFQQLLINPPGLEAIVSQVQNNEIAQQVYMVSLLTIRVDTADEQRYLDDLAMKLGLNIDQVQQLEQQFKQS